MRLLSVEPQTSCVRHLTVGNATRDTLGETVKLLMSTLQMLSVNITAAKLAAAAVSEWHGAVKTHGVVHEK